MTHGRPLLLILPFAFFCWCAFMLPVVERRATTAMPGHRFGEAARAARILPPLGNHRPAADEEAARARLLGAAAADSAGVARAGSDFIELAAASGVWTEQERASLEEHARLLRAAGQARRDENILTELTALADIIVELCDYDATLALLDAAQIISSRVHGPDHPGTATIIYKQAETHRLQGDHATARLLHQRALRIRESALGPTHPDVASSLTALSWIMRMNGDYPAGIEMVSRAIAIREIAPGPERRKLPMSLSSMAGIYLDMGELSRARALYERALRIWEADAGPDGTNVAIGLTNMALLLSRAGDHQAARQSALRALRIREKRFPAGHYMIARSLVNLAAALSGGRDDAAAAAALEEALALQEVAFGPAHFELARTLGILAEIRLRQGDFETALDLALQVESLARRSFQATARVLTESQILRYEAARSSGLDVALSAAQSAAGVIPGRRVAPAQHAQSPPSSLSSMVGRIWDEVIRSRAMVLDEIGNRHRDVGRAPSPAIASFAAEVSGARRRLAQLSVRGPGRAGPIEYAKALSAAQRSADRAEQSLAVASSEFRQAAGMSSAGLEEVTHGRPAGTALVAYLKYNHRAPGSWLAPVPSYVALVIGPGTEQPVMVTMGPAARLEVLVDSWRASAGSDPRLASDGAADETQREAGKALKEAIWDPISGLVRGASQVLVVPDASLSFVNLAALPDEDGRYLVESGPVIHYLSAERVVVGSGGPPPGGRGLLALGGPDFDDQSNLPGRVPRDAAPSQGEMGLMASYRGAAPPCEGFQSMRFGPLPASVAEARHVQELWQAHGFEGVLLTGAGADEGSFKRLAGRQRMLHLATHGFLLQGECSRSRGPGVDGDAWAAPAGNPMLLSGLVLAGANRRGDVLSPDDGEDGILTAEEIASLDLSGVEWAVLSGCETGLGRVLSGEGILGLRRAFEVAGARTLIMSLWKVEDEATRAWMSQLYGARMSGLTTAEAVRQASLQAIANQRARGRTTHPFFWGGFVAAGEWR